MAKTIPQLTDATTVNAADELIIQQGGITKRATGAELAKGLNTINGTINVRDFGAVGDGVADDTAAIQAAINSAASANGGTVVLPKGNYKITSTLTITSGSIALVGHLGANLVQHTTNTTFLRIGDGTLGTRPGIVRVERINFVLTSNTSTWTSAYAIEVDFAFFIHFEHLDIYGYDQSDFTTRRLINGIKLRKVQRFKAERCFIRGLASGGHCVYTIGETAGLNYCIDLTFENCYFDDFGGHGYYFDDFTLGTFLYNCVMVSSIGSSLITYDINSPNEDSNHYVYGLNAEAAGSMDGIVINRARLVQIQNGWFSAGNTKKAIHIGENASGIQIQGLWTTEGRWQIDGKNVSITDGYIGSLLPMSSYAVTIDGTGGKAELVDIRSTTIDQFAGGGVNLVAEPDRVSLTGVRFYDISGTAINGAGYNAGPIVDNISSNAQSGSSLFVTAAATMTFPYGREVFQITGATPIQNITLQNPGRRLYLQAGAGGFSFTSGGNIEVNTNAVTAFDVVELICLGASWYEVGR